MTDTSKQARTRRSPDKAFASTGAVAQTGGSLPIYICNTCEHDVVWCESKRTGKKYLVTVRRGHLDQRFYIGSQIHKCYARKEGSGELFEIDDPRLNEPVAKIIEYGSDEWVEQKIAQGFDPEKVRAAAAEEREEVRRALSGGK